tara:strand:- start:1073 stop:1435 length:363 start_codon:yes stop_codon:yes gene_type:complete
MSNFKRSISSAQNKQLIIAGSFAPAGTGAITAVKGSGFSAARTNAGEITITLTEKAVELVAALGSIRVSTAADMDVQFGDYVAASKTLILRTQAGATPTDIAADADNVVSFQLVIRLSDS